MKKLFLTFFIITTTTNSQGVIEKTLSSLLNKFSMNKNQYQQASFIQKRLNPITFFRHEPSQAAHFYGGIGLGILTASLWYNKKTVAQATFSTTKALLNTGITAAQIVDNKLVHDGPDQFYHMLGLTTLRAGIGLYSYYRK